MNWLFGESQMSVNAKLSPTWTVSLTGADPTMVEAEHSGSLEEQRMMKNSVLRVPAGSGEFESRTA